MNDTKFFPQNSDEKNAKDCVKIKELKWTLEC